MAYQIALPNAKEMEEKPILLCPMPMCKDKEELKRVHDMGAQAVERLIKEGKKIAFLTLGDPAVYSTYLYIHNRIKKKGLPCEIISGITSFCASAARLGMGLVENKQQLHIIPSSYDVEKELHLPGTKILMKAGKKMGEVKEIMKREQKQFYMVENCGMESEKVYTNVDDVPDETSYFKSRIHTSKCISVCSYYKNGRENSSTRKRKN